MKTWRERVAEAAARGKFTDGDRTDARAWTTCAVGEQHHKYPDVVVYISTGLGPEDGWLSTLGSGDGFFGAVMMNDPQAADRYLDEIEDRVLQLKRGEAPTDRFKGFRR